MDPFRNYDAWLEAPFQRAMEEGDRLAEEWERHCDEEGVDPEDEEAYQAWLSDTYSAEEDPREPHDDGHPDVL